MKRVESRSTYFFKNLFIMLWLSLFICSTTFYFRLIVPYCVQPAPDITVAVVLAPLGPMPPVAAGKPALGPEVSSLGFRGGQMLGAREERSVDMPNLKDVSLKLVVRRASWGCECIIF